MFKKNFSKKCFQFLNAIPIAAVLFVSTKLVIIDWLAFHTYNQFV